MDFVAGGVPKIFKSKANRAIAWQQDHGILASRIRSLVHKFVDACPQIVGLLFKMFQIFKFNDTLNLSQRSKGYAVKANPFFQRLMMGAFGQIERYAEGRSSQLILTIGR